MDIAKELLRQHDMCHGLSWANHREFGANFNEGFCGGAVLKWERCVFSWLRDM